MNWFINHVLDREGYAEGKRLLREFDELSKGHEDMVRRMSSCMTPAEIEAARQRYEDRLALMNRWGTMPVMAEE